MKYFLLILAMAGFINAKAIHSNFIKTDQKKETIDTSRYAIFKFNHSRDRYYFKGTVKPAALSNNDIRKIEALISIAVADYNKEYIQNVDERLKKYQQKTHVSKTITYSQTINNPSNYRKQFIAVINNKGEKEVWVNCVCPDFFSSSPYWKKEIVVVDDGGRCFFQLKINLTKGICFDFSVNGVA